MKVGKKAIAAVFVSKKGWIQTKHNYKIAS